MADEKLIAQLRSWDGTPFDDDAEAAADRIEAQAAEIERLRGDLKKAVESLEDISGNGSAAGRNPKLMADKARATLAELTGDQP